MILFSFIIKMKKQTYPNPRKYPSSQIAVQISQIIMGGIVNAIQVPKVRPVFWFGNDL